MNAPRPDGKREGPSERGELDTPEATLAEDPESPALGADEDTADPPEPNEPA
jgi:hypothetical protein